MKVLSPMKMDAKFIVNIGVPTCRIPKGHGQSGGSRMHITDFRHYVRDVFQHVEVVQKRFPGVPVYVLGHSMGGAVSLVAVLDRPDFFAGMILIGPVVTPEQDTVGPVRIFFGKLMARIFPHFPVLQISDEEISRDKAIVQKYKDDPLVYHGWMKAKWALSLLSALMEIEEKLTTIKLPFLVLHGGDDRIVSSKGSETLHKLAESTDKTIKIYPEGFHQLHADVEPVRSDSCKNIVDWLAKRVS
ncbi:monoglyceride lipase isoform X2 [Aplysia californica]|uniref:Monoglyceride lipase isoform X2 n=1 Tax=Aplysia californica TaxID=6500 RepID=A0ABM1W0N9_APLCA|nr:monoglyceride lipase isoform X2 [Aplysia californica]